MFSTLHVNTSYYIWALMPENLSSEFANNKGADQTAHPHSLISAFVIRYLESNIYTQAASAISIFKLFCVACPGFLASRPI